MMFTPCPFLCRVAVDSLQGVRAEVVDAIAQATKNCLNDTNLSIAPRKKVGNRSWTGQDRGGGSIMGRVGRVG